MYAAFAVAPCVATPISPLPPVIPTEALFKIEGNCSPKPNSPCEFKWKIVAEFAYCAAALAPPPFQNISTEPNGVVAGKFT